MSSLEVGFGLSEIPLPEGDAADTKIWLGILRFLIFDRP